MLHTAMPVPAYVALNPDKRG